MRVVRISASVGPEKDVWPCKNTYGHKRCDVIRHAQPLNFDFKMNKDRDQGESKLSLEIYRQLS